MHYVGIDNSLEDHKVRVIDQNGERETSFTIANNYQGFEELGMKLQEYKQSKIGFELPHGPIVEYLHEKAYDIYSLNPLKIKRYKETLKVSGDKNDNIDALAIAEYLRTNSSHIRAMTFNSSEIEKLKTLAIIHTRLTHNRIANLNKLHFIVRQYYPIQDLLFVDFGCNVQLNLIKKYPTFDNLSRATDKEISNFLKSHKYCRPDYINKLINKIRNFKQMISNETESTYQIEAHIMCDIILKLTEGMKKIEEEMGRITDGHYLGKYFRSLPGGGSSLACKLLALFGDQKDRFQNANAAQCLFGTAPKNYQSGPYHKVIMRKACNKSSRAILYKYAFGTLRFSKWAREYYDQQRKKGKTHSVAVRALSSLSSL